MKLFIFVISSLALGTVAFAANNECQIGKSGFAAKSVTQIAGGKIIEWPTVIGSDGSTWYVVNGINQSPGGLCILMGYGTTGSAQYAEQESPLVGVLVYDSNGKLQYSTDSSGYKFIKTLTCVP